HRRCAARGGDVEPRAPATPRGHHRRDSRRGTISVLVRLSSRGVAGVRVLIDSCRHGETRGETAEVWKETGEESCRQEDGGCQETHREETCEEARKEAREKAGSAVGRSSGCR